MSTQWTNYLGHLGLASDHRDVGMRGKELNAARDGAVFAPLLDFGLIRASGTDAGAFLHNLLSNDVLGITATCARFAGMCTPKGRLIATMLIWKDGEDILLMLPIDILAPILKKLSMYVLRSKVKLSDATADFALIGISRPVGITDLNDGLATYGVSPIEGGSAIRLDASRWLLAISPTAAIERWDALSRQASVVEIEVWQWLEIQAGQPRVVAATQEAFVPQMLNMELPAVAGVSFTKGCYPGQEIVARTQYLGKIKRRMVRVHVEVSDKFSPGTAVFSAQTGDQQCGSVVSCAAAPGGGVDALICAQSSALESGEINLGSPTGPRPIVLTLPYSVELGTGENGSV